MRRRASAITVLCVLGISGACWGFNWAKHNTNVSVQSFISVGARTGVGKVVVSAAQYTSKQVQAVGQGAAARLGQLSVATTRMANVILESLGTHGGSGDVGTDAKILAYFNMSGAGSHGDSGDLAIDTHSPGRVNLAGQGAEGGSGIFSPVGGTTLLINQEFSGSGGSGGAGELTVTGIIVANVLLGPEGAAGSIGDVVATAWSPSQADVTLAGQGSTGGLGPVAVTAVPYGIDLAGQGAVGGLGSLGLRASIVAAASGQGGSGGIGDLATVTTAMIRLAGQGGAGSIAMPTKTVTTSVMNPQGQGAVGGVGTIAARTTAVIPVSGQGAAAASGGLSVFSAAYTTVALTGQGAASGVSSPSVLQGVDVYGMLTGASGGTGNLTPFVSGSTSVDLTGMGQGASGGVTSFFPLTASYYSSSSVGATGGAGTMVAATAPPPYLINDTFDAGTNPGYTGVSGVTFNNTATPELNSTMYAKANTISSAAVRAFTPSDTVFMTGAVYSQSGGGDYVDNLTMCTDSAGSTCPVFVRFFISLVGIGTNYANTPSTFTGATWTYFKVQIVKGTGSNGIARLWLSPDGYTWTLEGEVTNGTNTAQLQSFVIHGWDSTRYMRWDSLKISNSDIPDAR